LKHAVIMNRAKELLHVAETPLAEVSYLLGFSEPSSFHRAFRRWTGKTPGQWRINC
jgi:AraC-like DNA-binding protein